VRAFPRFEDLEICASGTCNTTFDSPFFMHHGIYVFVNKKLYIKAFIKDSVSTEFSRSCVFVCRGSNPMRIGSFKTQKT
jgi:hypothetical protein